MQVNLSYPNTHEVMALGEVSGEMLVARITKTNFSAAGKPIYLRRGNEGVLLPVTLDQA